ncbi:NlpC/P60 family protein [Streptomyces sp. NPDC089919]|uniref:C40 family peptidase n=1 Tax=Streptomyces sp. NPDC089919 TaxID=3155188 RepID=UPI0034426BA8
MLLSKIALVSCLGVGAALVSGGPAGPPALGAVGRGTACGSTAVCYVDVPVAEVWTDPADVRPVDAPAVGHPADVRGWLEGMSEGQLRRIPGETQALYGTRVTVTDSQWYDGVLWDHVWVHGQPTPKDTAGRGAYPGWVPDRQLVRTPPPAPAGTHGERVVRRTAWGYASAEAARARGAAGRTAEYSYNTAFAVGPGTVDGVTAAATDDGPVFFRSTDLAAVPQEPSGADVVAEARAFLGLPYAWSGASGFGFDCSGLTSQVYARLGVVIPRDAGPQFDAGTGAAPAGSARGVRVHDLDALRPGDVVAFRAEAGGPVVHVGVHTRTDEDGEALMIDAPGTGEVVREEPIVSSGHVFAGATRFLAR